MHFRFTPVIGCQHTSAGEVEEILEGGGYGGLEAPGAIKGVTKLGRVGGGQTDEGAIGAAELAVRCQRRR